MSLGYYKHINYKSSMQNGCKGHMKAEISNFNATIYGKHSVTII